MARKNDIHRSAVAPWHVMSSKNEEIRLRYLYRGLILSGKAKLSLEAARGLVGPDCAYHLYGVVDLSKSRPTSKHDSGHHGRRIKK